MKFTREQINKIIRMKAPDGVPIDIFDLHGVLYVGNCRMDTLFVPHEGIKRTKIWDIEKNHTKFSSHSLPILESDFEWCETEEEVRNAFHEALEEAVKEKLV